MFDMMIPGIKDTCIWLGDGSAGFGVRPQVASCCREQGNVMRWVDKKLRPPAFMKLQRGEGTLAGPRR